MTRQSRSTWQRAERHVAGALGTTRNGNTGHATADVTTGAWCVEVKSWRTMPAKVLAALQQAERAAAGQQTPIAVLHQVGGRHDQDLVVLRWRDFAGLLLGDHDTDRRTAARIAGIIHLSEAPQEEIAILAPDVVIE